MNEFGCYRARGGNNLVSKPVRQLQEYRRMQAPARGTSSLYCMSPREEIIHHRFRGIHEPGCTFSTTIVLLVRSGPATPSFRASKIPAELHTTHLYIYRLHRTLRTWSGAWPGTSVAGSGPSWVSYGDRLQLIGAMYASNLNLIANSAGFPVEWRL